MTKLCTLFERWIRLIHSLCKKLSLEKISVRQEIPPHEILYSVVSCILAYSLITIELEECITYFCNSIALKSS